MRIIDALLPVLELAAEQCRKLANEPEPTSKPVAAVIEPNPAVVIDPPPAKPRRRPAEPEPETLPALGQGITRMEVQALRSEERTAWRLIRDNGPLTVRAFARLYFNMKPAIRHRVLSDLDRYGLIASYWDAKGRSIIHATGKLPPPDDVDERARPRRHTRAETQLKLAGHAG